MASTTVGTVNFHHSVGENFPTPLRTYNVDSGVQSRITRDYLPLNANLDSTQITDSYIEFILNPSDREFFNLGKIFLELQLRITRPNGTDLEDDDVVSVIDSVGTSIISRASVYLNGSLVEGNSHFGIWSTIRQYLGYGLDDHKTFGELNFMKNINSPIPDRVDAAYFADATADKYEKPIIAACRDTIHLMAPLHLDISSVGFYLLDNIEIRIRLDLQPASFILLTSSAVEFAYKISLAKLHVEKICPNPSALLSLNESMRKENSSIEYLIERPILKTFVFPSRHTNLIMDNVFNGYIPGKVIIFIVSQQALSGAYGRNPLYLNNCSIQNIRLEIDGQLKSTQSGNFTNKPCQFLMNTIQNISSKDNSISLSNFKAGRTIFIYDLQASDASDVISIDKKGCVRVSITAEQSGVQENYSVFVVGLMNGNIIINSERIVKTSFLM